MNPAARGERAKSKGSAIDDLSKRVVVRETKAAGDGETMAKLAIEEGFETIIAAGGDGTINEVVNGIGESEVTFGILPVGTMNVFALELGIPVNDLEKGWEVVEAGHTRDIDLPRANDEFFVQLAGVGLDAEVVGQVTPDQKKVLGPVSYVLSLAQVAARKPPLIHLRAGDGTEREGCFLLVGNGRFYGGPVELFPDAKPDDGLLDVVLFKNQSHWDVLRYLHAIAFGSHPELPDVEYFQTAGLQVSSETDVPVELDGDLAGSVPFEFGFAKRKLRVLAPPVDYERNDD